MFLKIVTSELNFCYIKEKKQMEKSKTNTASQSEMVLHLCQAEVEPVIH